MRLPRAILFTAIIPLLGACATFKAARLYQRGSRALERGDTGLAITSFEAAANKAPRASEIQNHLGLAYAASGRDADALDAFRRAVALDCGNAAARENLIAAQARRASVSP